MKPYDKPRLLDVESLRPCPFCGNSRAEVITDVDEFVAEWGDDGWHQEEMLKHLRKRPYYAVCCSVMNDGCGAISGWKVDKTSAIAAWNRRVDE